MKTPEIDIENIPLHVKQGFLCEISKCKRNEKIHCEGCVFDMDLRDEKNLKIFNKYLEDNKELLIKIKFV